MVLLGGKKKFNGVLDLWLFIYKQLFAVLGKESRVASITNMVAQNIT